MAKIINLEQASKELQMRKNQKKKWAEKGSKMVPAKTRLTNGLLNTIAFMRIIDEAMTRLNATKQLSRDLELELMTSLRLGKKILHEFFALSEKEVDRIWKGIDDKFITKKATSLYKIVTKKIITSDEPAFSSGIKDMKMNFDETLK